MKPGAQFTQEIPQGWNAFIYTLAGSTTFVDGTKSSPQTIGPYHNVVFNQSPGDSITVSTSATPPSKDANTEFAAEGDSRFIIVAGQPLDQKVVQYGPFVMNSQEEVYQAVMDFQSATNGFERSRGWRSEIGKTMRD